MTNGQHSDHNCHFRRSAQPDKKVWDVGGRMWRGIFTVGTVIPSKRRCHGREAVLLLEELVAVSDCAGKECVVSVVSAAL